ncbi:MAG: response regulator transcription factor [Bacteroidota bacterium]|nr:response regulator transcription factor [Bacteroidota bacterium]
MDNKRHKILLAEDDLNLGMLLLDFLEGEGFEVRLCRDGELAWRAFEQHSFDMCLLDIMMPKMDGFALAKLIKEKQRQMPIIFISAKSLKADKLQAYGLGADDYICKPFDEEELLWKIRAILRRLPEPMPLLKEPVAIGEYWFNPGNQSLQMGEHLKRMTEKESEVLHYLFCHKNKVIKREELLEAVWGENDYFLGRSLDVFISKLRKYLKDDESLSIETVFGVGFIFNVRE